MCESFFINFLLLILLLIHTIGPVSQCVVAMMSSQLNLPERSSSIAILL